MKNVRYCLLGILILAYLGGCAPPPSPVVQPFGDSKHWVVVDNMEWVVGSTQDRIVVPKGFVTDFASIPQALWSLGLSPHGQYSRAAVIHDYLYWAQSCTREQADRLMLIAMKESSVSGIDEKVIYQVVKTAGGRAWRSNAKERSAGLPRIVPDKYLRPADPNMDWPTYREILTQQGVTDPPFASNPAYCSYGNSTDVP